MIFMGCVGGCLFDKILGYRPFSAKVGTKADCEKKRRHDQTGNGCQGPARKEVGTKVKPRKQATRCTKENLETS